jgi:hypothetical protein
VIYGSFSLEKGSGIKKDKWCCLVHCEKKWLVLLVMIAVYMHSQIEEI